MQHHKGVDAGFFGVSDEGIRDLILNIAWTDATHTFVRSLALEFDNVVFGETGQGLAIIKFELLQQSEVSMFRGNQAR
ncbi:hypothetical protein HRbin36_02171 [bacterium HR36]|nr:hypothetical protein HRbin36_02171 [bacterium HR36]